MKAEIDHLLVKVLNGSASKEEIVEFAEWIKDHRNEEYFGKLKEMWHVAKDSELQAGNQHQSNTIIEQAEMERLMSYIRRSRRNTMVRKFAVWTTSAAASLVMVAAILKIAGIAGWGVNQDFSTLAYSTDSVRVELNDGEMVRTIKGTTGAVNVIDPGRVLADGTTSEKTAAQTTANTNKVAAGKANGASRPKTYTSVTTPPGERVAMVLSDGTRVYLTSNSYLKYPTTFDDDKREVTLVGRAYFEVSKSKTPFLVNTSDMEVEVLGTSFDVESHSNNHNANVILVEGSVKVNTKKGSRIIKPNEQLSIHRRTNESTVTNVDSKLLTMWKDGVLIVRGQTFGELLENLSAWYGVKIIDRTNLNTIEKFNGRFDREDIEAAIQAVCISAKIKYKIVNGYLVLEDL